MVSDDRTKTLTYDEVEHIIKTTEPDSMSDRGDQIWTRRMAVALADQFNKRIKTALEAALAQGNGAVGVKGLEWKRTTNPPGFEADTPIARAYRIDELAGSDSPSYETSAGGSWTLLYEGDDLPSAKSAAQTDYEARIRSALFSEAEAVRGGQEPVAWRVRPMPGFDWVFVKGDPDRDPALNGYEKQPVYASPPSAPQPSGQLETRGNFEAVSERTENDNFHTSIYESDYKGLLIARCNQNGKYPWQARAILAGLNSKKEALDALASPPADRGGEWEKALAAAKAATAKVTGDYFTLDAKIEAALRAAAPYLATSPSPEGSR